MVRLPSSSAGGRGLPLWCCSVPVAGTPYGGFVPTVKIATNSELAAKKKHWIDFDAGRSLIHGKAMPQLLNEFVDAIVELANGKQTCNERNRFPSELAVFKSGVTL